MSESNNSSRRDFTKGVAVGTMAGALASMGVYSYSPLRKQHFAKAAAPQENIGEVKSVKITNISETSWFDNKVLMGDIKGPEASWSTITPTTGHPSPSPKASWARGAMRTG